MLFGYKILAYCTSKIYENKFNEFISSLNDELVANNWRVMVFCTETDLYKDNKNNKGDRNIFDLINYDITDALLISDMNLHDVGLKKDMMKKARENNVPVFMFDGNYENTYNIKFNQFNGFEKVVRHIVEQHEIRSLHFIAGTKESEHSNVRLEAFKSILNKNNIPFDDSMVSYGDFWEIPTAAVVQKLIDEGRVPRAIICANDTMAIATVSTLKKNGFKCPRDVIVTGFDGIDSIFFSSPKITSALCNYQTLGIEIAHFIFDTLDSNTPPNTKYVDPSIIISESCGCESITPAHSLDYISFLSIAYSHYRIEDKRLSNLSSLIRDCNTIDEVIKTLRNGLLFNMFCLVKAEYIDNTKNPNISYTESTYGDEMYILLDSDNDQPTNNCVIKTKDLLKPERMKELLDTYKKPLLFTPLNNMDQSIGYLCFCYQNYDQHNYMQINQMSTWLSHSLVGFRNIKYQQFLQKQIEDLYSHDSLTGLYNRHGFMRIYEDLLNDFGIESISLAMCDLDNLKKINDKYSHNEGDNAIRIVGKALSEAGVDGYFCRYGGDEIIGLYPYPVDSYYIQNQVQEYLDKYNNTSGKPYKVSTSIGIYTSKKAPFKEMFAKADELMYKQKISKKDRRK